MFENWFPQDMTTLRKLLWFRSAWGESGKPPVPSDPLNTFVGSIVRFFSHRALPVVQLEANFTPIQSGTGDPSPDNIRPISGHTGAEVYDDPKYGGTINWNQLAPTLDTTNWSKASNVSFWDVTDGVATLTVNTTSTSNTFVKPDITPPPSGHVVYVCADMKCDNPQSGQKATIRFYESSSRSQIVTEQSASSSWEKHEALATLTVSAVQIRFYVSSPGAAYTYYIKNPQVFDLTEMFGVGNEPSTVEEFKSLFPKDYYAYNAGEETCVSAVNGDPYVKVSISFGTTVYGCQLTVNEDGSGQIEASKAYGLLNDPDKWVAQSGTVDFSYNQDFTRMLYSDSYTGLICTIAKAAYSTGVYCRWLAATSPKFGIKDAVHTLAEIKTMASNGDIAICYDIEPVTIPLTAQQIQTLVGTNTIWVNDATGDITVQAYGTEIV